MAACEEQGGQSDGASQPGRGEDSSAAGDTTGFILYRPLTKKKVLDA